MSLRGRGTTFSRQAAVQHLRARRSTRALRVEKLEDRRLLATYTYPYGAQPYDTGEFMLGDVAVNVVFMESNPELAPYDNNLATDPLHPGRGAPSENWTSQAIAQVKANVTAGLQWWKDTLYSMFPTAPANLLNFQINWQHADNPVQTGYEPIARVSDDFYVPSSTPQRGWLYDFLTEVGFDYTGNFSSDIRSYNDYTRQTAGADWAFTIFVVNNAADADKMFAQGGSFRQAFAFAGGRFMIVPASRPASTFAHEIGHQFWAIDQYPGGGTYASQRGYYNTPNLNAWDNPNPSYVRVDSIMSRDELYEGANPPKTPDLYLSNAFNNHTSDKYALAQVGWQDTDLDGIFDVLDVPFSLSGSGTFNATTGIYKFTGSTVVGTLPNLNTSGGGSDITINQINVIQASIDGGPWQTIKAFESRTYQVSNFTLDIPVPDAGIHEIRLRSADLRTGVSSKVFIDDVETPSDPPTGVTGIVFRDLNYNGRFDPGELPQPDVSVEVFDDQGQSLNFFRDVEPSLYAAGSILNNVAANEGVTISATGPGVASADVYSRISTLVSGNNRVFEADLAAGGAAKVWNANQKLRVDFAAPVSSVSLKALRPSNAGSAGAYGRLEAYSSDGTLLTRFNTQNITSPVTMTVTRNAGDIAYVIAYGRFDTSVVLDTLQWGAATSTTSNSTGAYSLGSLPTGTYRVQVFAPSGYAVTTPLPHGYATVFVQSGQAASTVDFGIATQRAHPFHNPDNPFNVDNDEGNNVSPIDALMVINYLNARPGAEGEISEGDLPGLIGFVDVDDDGYCAPGDALAVINYINANRPSGGGEGGEGFSSDELIYSGALQVLVPRTPAEYLAANGELWRNLPSSDEPCSCATCVGAHTDAAIAELSASSPSNPLPLGSSLETGQNQSKRPANRSHHPVVLDPDSAHPRLSGVNRARRAFLASEQADEADGKPVRDAAASDEVLSALFGELPTDL
jgi:hypothetical protein